jgi:hypothetical protein
MERLQFHILRNLQIEIKNIHIAFDDKTTKSYPFQFGIIFNSFKLDVFIFILFHLFIYSYFRQQIMNRKMIQISFIKLNYFYQK